MKRSKKTQELRQWVQQWKETGVFLDEMRRYELAHLTPEQAMLDAASVLSIPGGWRNPNVLCGLIEQQAIFQRLRTK